MTNKENRLVEKLILAALETLKMLESQGIKTGDIHDDLQSAIKNITNNYSFANIKF